MPTILRSSLNRLPVGAQLSLVITNVRDIAEIGLLTEENYIVIVGKDTQENFYVGTVETSQFIDIAEKDTITVLQESDDTFPRVVSLNGKEVKYDVSEEETEVV